jgi:hypothetical protein
MSGHASTFGCGDTQLAFCMYRMYYSAGWSRVRTTLHLLPTIHRWCIPCLRGHTEHGVGHRTIHFCVALPNTPRPSPYLHLQGLQQGICCDRALHPLQHGMVQVQHARPIHFYVCIYTRSSTCRVSMPSGYHSVEQSISRAWLGIRHVYMVAWPRTCPLLCTTLLCMGRVCTCTCTCVMYHLLDGTIYHSAPQKAGWSGSMYIPLPASTSYHPTHSCWVGPPVTTLDPQSILPLCTYRVSCSCKEWVWLLHPAHSECTLRVS